MNNQNIKVKIKITMMIRNRIERTIEKAITNELIFFTINYALIMLYFIFIIKIFNKLIIHI